MKTQSAITLLVSALLLIYCKQEKKPSEENELVYADSIALEPMIDSLQKSFENFSIGLLKKQSRGLASVSDTPKTRNDLKSLKTVVKVLDGSIEAGVTIPGFGGLKLSSKEKCLSVYYIESKLVDTTVWGIGYSVHYLFRKLKKGINITNLASVAASVQLERSKSEVVYCLQSYGISGNHLTKYFKPVVDKDFDVQGFGIMQSSIDGIHNILYDSTLSAKTQFTPIVLNFVSKKDLQ